MNLLCDVITAFPTSPPLFADLQKLVQDAENLQAEVEILLSKDQFDETLLQTINETVRAISFCFIPIYC